LQWWQRERVKGGRRAEKGKRDRLIQKRNGATDKGADQVREGDTGSGKKEVLDSQGEKGAGRIPAKKVNFTVGRKKNAERQKGAQQKWEGRPDPETVYAISFTMGGGMQCNKWF